MTKQIKSGKWIKHKTHSLYPNQQILIHEDPLQYREYLWSANELKRAIKRNLGYKALKLAAS